MLLSTPTLPSPSPSPPSLLPPFINLNQAPISSLPLEIADLVDPKVQDDPTTKLPPHSPSADVLKTTLLSLPLLVLPLGRQPFSHLEFQSCQRIYFLS